MTRLTDGLIASAQRDGLEPLPYEPIEPGDLYYARRNGPGVLLTCSFVHLDGYIVSVEPAYPYDVGECVKVRA